MLSEEIASSNMRHYYYVRSHYSNFIIYKNHKKYQAAVPFEMYMKKERFFKFAACSKQTLLKSLN